MDPAESIKIYKNKDCAVCDDGREDVEDGEDVEEGEEGGNISSFSCYNPFLRRKSAGKLRLALFSPCLLDKTFR